MGFLMLKRGFNGKETQEMLHDSNTRENEPLSLKSSSLHCRSRNDSRIPVRGLAGVKHPDV